MFKRIVFAAAALLCAVNIYSISFSVNSSLWKNYDDSELNELVFDIVETGGVRTRGISLNELFPVLYDAWAINIEAERIIISNLADKLQDIFITSDSSGWEIEFDGKIYKNIQSLNIEGEVLADKPLEIWINWEGTEFLREEIKRYTDLHRLEIRITEVPRPDSKLTSMARGGGTVPDVLMVQSSYIDSLVRSGSIQNIDYMYPEGLQKLVREAFTYSGKTWAVPFYYDAQMLFYNPELITGPQNHWSLTDFERCCQRATATGKIPSAWNAYSAGFLIPFQISFGKQRLIETNGSINISDEPSKKALEYIIDLKNRELMTPMERDAMTSLFVSGDVAMIIDASYSIPHFQDLGIPFEAVALPINSKTGIRVSPLLDFKALAVTKKSKNPTGARRLIEYLTGFGVQSRFTTSVSKMPARESAFSLQEDQNRFSKALKISADSGTIIPTDKAYSVYKNTMWKMLRFAISGRMPPGQVLEKTQELVNKNLEDIN
jgi:ABC-type glycerol-3-phosphate transport system substrate-binding protein